MTKIQVNEVKAGMLVKVGRKVQSDGSVITIAAHTKSAAPARVIAIEEAGRYIFIDTDMGSIMMGRGGKMTIV